MWRVRGRQFRRFVLRTSLGPSAERNRAGTRIAARLKSGLSGSRDYGPTKVGPFRSRDCGPAKVGPFRSRAAARLKPCPSIQRNCAGGIAPAELRVLSQEVFGVDILCRLPMQSAAQGLWKAASRFQLRQPVGGCSSLEHEVHQARYPAKFLSREMWMPHVSTRRVLRQSQEEWRKTRTMNPDAS
jgi:hypothetical protein